MSWLPQVILYGSEEHDLQGPRARKLEFVTINLQMLKVSYVQVYQAQPKSESSNIQDACVVIIHSLTEWQRIFMAVG